MKQEDSSDGADSGNLVIGPSTWFYRRIGILMLLTGGLGLYFLYDGAIGYPKKNFTVDLHDAFDAGHGCLR